MEEATQKQAARERTGERWIVGLDGSEDSIRALKWAAALAPNRASTLKIVRSWTYAALGGLDVGAPGVIEAMRPKVVYELIDEFTAEMESVGVRVEWDVIFGSAAPMLLDACDDADLLVVGTRGRGGFARLLVGSTSHQCATHAKVPVAVIPKNAATDGSITEIVVGMDASLGAKAALVWATEFASEGTPIRVVGAWHPGWLDADLYAWEIEEKRARKEFDAAIDEVEEASGNRGVLHREFVSGHPGRVLLAESKPTSLVVVGERGQRGLKAALLGSVATEMLHRATGPVVVVPAGG
jgi:nucleotide-binding universal stress UspA family protein